MAEFATVESMTDKEWLDEMFVDSLCAECELDAEDHTVVDFMGNRFARCNTPIPE